MTLESVRNVGPPGCTVTATSQRSRASPAVASMSSVLSQYVPGRRPRIYPWPCRSVSARAIRYLACASCLVSRLVSVWPWAFNISHLCPGLTSSRLISIPSVDVGVLHQEGAHSVQILLLEASIFFRIFSFVLGLVLWRGEITVESPIILSTYAWKNSGTFMTSSGFNFLTNSSPERFTHWLVFIQALSSLETSSESMKAFILAPGAVLRLPFGYPRSFCSAGRRETNARVRQCRRKG